MILLFLFTLLLLSLLQDQTKADSLGNITETLPLLPPRCDFFKGNWFPDPNFKPIYDSRCPFIDPGFNCLKFGRRDRNYLNYRWHPLNCAMPSFNAVLLLQKWRGKKIMFVGDSLSLNQYQSLLCMIMGSLHSAKTFVRKENSLTSVFFTDYDVTIMLDRTPFLVDITSEEGLGAVLKLDSIQGGKLWMGMDVLIFNTWHWWTHTGDGQPWNHVELRGKVLEDMDRRIAYYQGLTTWARWINLNIDPSKTQVFFQGVSPTHYIGRNWERPAETCGGQTEPYSGDRYQADTLWATSVLGRVLGRLKKPVVLLDVTTLSEYRKDAHPSYYGGGGKNHHAMDCSHWCLPGLPDTWNELLYAELFR